MSFKALIFFFLKKNIQPQFGQHEYYISFKFFFSKQTFAINLFQEKMSFTGETSTIDKDAKYRSETKNIHFFSYNVYFVFQKSKHIEKDKFLHKIH